jgi:outer membrane protein TolC
MKVIQNIIAAGLFISAGPLAGAQETLSLEGFLSEVSAKNLSIKAQNATAEGANAAAAGFALPAPMVGVTQTQDQSGRASGFEVSQTMPFPTKLTSDRSARRAEAEAQSAAAKGQVRETLAEAKITYFRLWQGQERVRLLLEKKAAIGEHIKLSTASARSDSFLKIHLIKTETDLDLLENEILQAEQEHHEQMIQAALLLNRDPHGFKPSVQEPVQSKMPIEKPTAQAFALEAKKFELESFKARESEADSLWLPDFNFRYREMAGTPMAPKFSEVMVGVSLPFIFFWEPRAASSKAASERMRAEAVYDLEKRKVEAARASLLSKAELLLKQMAVFQEKLLPKAEKRVRLVHNIAQRDMETLQDHRETMEALPELKLRVLELRTKYEETIAELEKYSSGEKK